MPAEASAGVESLAAGVKMTASLSAGITGVPDLVTYSCPLADKAISAVNINADTLFRWISFSTRYDDGNSR